MRRTFQIAALVLTPLAVFGAMIWADRSFGHVRRAYAYVNRVELPPADRPLGLPKILGPADAGRPLVVIDPGHGGRDPGAGTGTVKEKALTLALGLALRDALLGGGGIRVALTRSDDRYLFLEERQALTRALRPDVFVSIHADAADNDQATGATVYTLSARGSNEVADKFAARENAADTVNGIAIKGQSDAVNAILVDLSQRDAQARSEELARLILREGAGKIPFRERSEQSAAFAVLKQPDIPAVLFESGYISNPADAARLGSTAGRDAFAEATARAIRAFLARQSLR